jgi:phage terminase large subunit
MPELILPANNWQPRPYQRALWGYLEGGGKRADAVWHRRSGKDELALHWTACASQTKSATYWHMLPQASQARKAIWDAVNPHTGKRRIDEAFPGDLRETTRNNEMAIQFKSGSHWQVVGSDNYDSLVGSPPAGVVFSEWPLSNPAAWAYIQPILEENGGWAIFNGTPRGRNHGKTLYDMAKGDPEWFAEKLSARDTGVFTERQLINIEREYIQLFGLNDGKARFRQEYLCDFDAAVSGSYYASEMDLAERDGRIGDAMWRAEHPVHTSWDLGVNDMTVIWFFQYVGDAIRVIDYVSNNSVDPGYFVNELRQRPYTYGTHLLPHDGKTRDKTSNMTYQQTLSSLGVQSTVVPVGPVYDGINAVRRMLSTCVFNKAKCSVGIDALKNYRREWDEKKKVFADAPLHDWASHPADAFRTFAMGQHLIISPDAGWSKPLKYPAMGLA